MPSLADFRKMASATGKIEGKSTTETKVKIAFGQHLFTPDCS